MENLNQARAQELATGAMVVVNDASASGEVTIKINRDLLDCSICVRPLKPPTVQCGVGHLACQRCYLQLSTNQCHVPCCTKSYSRCPAIDAFISQTLVTCPNKEYGCLSNVTYNQADNHVSACPHAPCACAASQSCNFVGSPQMLLGHLIAEPHSWPLTILPDEKSLRFELQVLESESQRLLITKKDDGGVQHMFIVALGDRGNCIIPVTVACIRATAAAGPQFTCFMSASGHAARATGIVPRVMLGMEVPNTVAPGEATTNGVPFLSVPSMMLHGESRVMRLSIRLDRVSD